jgi:uncharacterized membrane protein HdeD (DUF308 family)
MATAHTAFPDLTITRALASSWWLVLLRGIVGVAFGVAAVVWPGITLFALVLLWGAYAFVDGVLALVAAIKHRGGAGKTWWLIFAGVVGLAAGILAFVWPGITSWALVMLIGAWAFVHGIFEIVGAIRLRREIDNEWALAIAGALSAIVGLGIMIFPGAGALALVWMIAFYAIIFGVSLIFLAFRLRSRRSAAGEVHA